ncbi:MAG: RNA methyltransferase, partial [Pseudomonadota bacterium]
MPIVDITDANDPRIAAYTQIKERDLTGRGDRFIVEGKVTLGVLVERSVFEIESLFLSETRLEPLSHVIAAIDPDIPIYVARQTVMDDVAGFSIHRGVLACARKGQPR